MGPIVSSVFLLSVSLLSKVTISHGLSRRFFVSDILVDKLVPSRYKLQECILCLCYQECHSGQFSVDENHLCKDYVNTIKCSEVDRCSCCNDLALDVFKPCQNNGQCRDLGHGNFTCDCPSGHYGKRCELNDACGDQQCGAHGVCRHHETFPFYRCNCSQGYFGNNCEYNFCDVKHCNNGGSCIPLDNHPFFLCQCANGYTGDTCEAALMKPTWTQVL